MILDNLKKYTIGTKCIYTKFHDMMKILYENSTYINSDYIKTQYNKNIQHIIQLLELLELNTVVVYIPTKPDKSNLYFTLYFINLLKSHNIEIEIYNKQNESNNKVLCICDDISYSGKQLRQLFYDNRFQFEKFSYIYVNVFLYTNVAKSIVIDKTFYNPNYKKQNTIFIFPEIETKIYTVNDILTTYFGENYLENDMYIIDNDRTINTIIE
jgi:hypothetical protein